jgi:DNA-binding HxlR family transcriptional regulator
MRYGKYERTAVCAVELCLEVIGGKWKGAILRHLVDGTKRFGELRRLMPMVTQRMLTTQLRELEDDGVIVRTVYPQVPPKVEYALSESGKTLAPIIALMQRWGDDLMARRPDIPANGHVPVPTVLATPRMR